MAPYYVIKLLNPRDHATVGYYRAGRYVPVLHNWQATRYATGEEARGVASRTMPDHDFGAFLGGYHATRPLLQIVKVVP